MRLKLKAIKKEGILFKIGQGLLLLIVSVVIAYQVYRFDWRSYAWSLPGNWASLILAMLFVSLNWFFEWKKWSISLTEIEDEDETKKKRAFYSGMISGFLTPSALGNFLGRMFVYEKEMRSQVISLTIFSNGAQFLTSILFGALSLLFLSSLDFWSVMSGLNFVVLPLCGLGFILYFFFEKIPFLKFILEKYIPSFTKVSYVIKFKFLGYSILRYLVFSSQFYLIIVAFQPQLGLAVLFWVWNLYLWTTLSPSLLIGKLIIRETLAISILTEGGVELPIALIAGLIVWLINNALPSLYAYFKIKRNVVV